MLLLHHEVNHNHQTIVPKHCSTTEVNSKITIPTTAKHYHERIATIHFHTHQHSPTQNHYFQPTNCRLNQTTMLTSHHQYWTPAMLLTSSQLIIPPKNLIQIHFQRPNPTNPHFAKTTLTIANFQGFKSPKYFLNPHSKSHLSSTKSTFHFSEPPRQV